MIVLAKNPIKRIQARKFQFKMWVGNHIDLFMGKPMQLVKD